MEEIDFQLLPLDGRFLLTVALKIKNKSFEFKVFIDIDYYPLPVTSYPLPVTRYQLPVTSYLLSAF